jgi:subtilisin family serine protease
MACSGCASSQDSSRSPSDVTGGVYGYADTLHATGVLGILAGGVPLPSRRWVGIAPDAELVNAAELSLSDGGRMLWALDQGPDVLLHEYVTWTRVPLDGSDPVAAIIDEATALGVASVCPVGNLGAADRHAERELADGEAITLRLSVPERLSQLELALHARGGGRLEADLLLADGTALPFTVDAREQALPGAQLTTYGETTARGTEVLHAVLYGSDLAVDGVRLRARAGALTVHAYTADEYGFSLGAAWEGATAEHTVAAPATADTCLAVGATPAFAPSEGPWYGGGPEAIGEVRAYSGRGPRIDGALRPHVLAPDNPWSALGHGEVLPSRPGFLVAEHGAYMVFGGTSGAGPHAAGVVALLAQTGLRGEPSLARVRETAIADDATGPIPNDDYGHGRLSAVAALGGEPAGASPSLTLRATPSRVRSGESVTLRVEAADPDGGPIEVRWDDGYDGSWDTEYERPTSRIVSFTQPGTYRWKVRARGATGRVAEAVARVVVSEEAPSVDAGGQVDAGAADAGVEPAGGGCACRVGARRGGRMDLPGWALAVAVGVAWRSRRRRR